MTVGGTAKQTCIVSTLLCHTLLRVCLMNMFLSHLKLKLYLFVYPATAYLAFHLSKSDMDASSPATPFLIL